MMQFRVAMTKDEFVRISQALPGSSHEIRFGRDVEGKFTADRHATLVFQKKADDFSDSPDDVRSLIVTVSDGRRSIRMTLTLFPKYGGKGVVQMKPVPTGKSRQ